MTIALWVAITVALWLVAGQVVSVGAVEGTREGNRHVVAVAA